MKVKFLFGAIFVISVFLIPLLALRYSPPEGAHPAAVGSASAHINSRTAKTANEAYSTPKTESTPIISVDGTSEYGVDSFKILDRTTGKIAIVSLRDYVRGAVASEMPAAFHPEALKAQAVAAHTYALYNYYQQQRSPDPALKGADFSADPSRREGYITEQTAREFYGEAYADFYWDKICTAADEVLQYIMEHDGEPIVAAYHAISAGQTEDSGNVWRSSVPYLAPAESIGCVFAPDYETVTKLTVDEARRLLLAKLPQLDFSAPPEDWFYILERSDSGYVTQIEVAGEILHGKDIREALGLRSHCLELDYAGNVFTFTVWGHGHGVGLSQYGADFMARQGSTFEEILQNYYSGVVIKKASSQSR